jgi:DNA-binding transcriptional ArsR family regulator
MPKNIPCPKLSEGAIQLVAARLRVLGDVSRLKPVLAVEAGEKNVSELVAATGLSQPNISQVSQVISLHALYYTFASSLRRTGTPLFVRVWICRDVLLMISDYLQKQLALQARTFRKRLFLELRKPQRALRLQL